MDLFVIISEKLYCSRLNRCGQFEKSEKNMYISKIYKSSVSNIEKKNYREIDYEEKNYFFFYLKYVW